MMNIQFKILLKLRKVANFKGVSIDKSYEKEIEDEVVK